MKPWQQQFIELALEYEALGFGEFTLKSGRVSPYFFNAGRFASGKAVATLGRSYAAALSQSGIDCDMLFGPAYKGIVLASCTAAALSDVEGKDIPFVYNRKEVKTHGEGGQLVGPPLKGRVVIVDDVITAGTAVREAVSMIEEAGAELAGVLVGLDRRERGQGELSAIQEVERDYGIPVVSIIQLDDILQFLREQRSDPETVAAIERYRQQYGIGTET